MDILMLAEGNPATRDSWSGISLSVLTEFCRRGHRVIPGDCELYGLARYLTAARTFGFPMKRWRNRFRLGEESFEARSRRAAHVIDRLHGPIDLIMQAGATFEPRGRGSVPYVLYCDSNFKMAERGAASGHSQAVALSEPECARVIAREAAVYEGAAIIFTISDRLRESFIDDFRISPEKVVTVHAGANLTGTVIPTKKHDSDPIILFVGRAFQRKGGDLLLRAFGRVRAEMPRARLVIIGPDSIPGDNPGVTNLGFLDKDDPVSETAMARVYAESTIFCLPTRYEPFGVAFLEAMSYGIPCVGTSIGAVPEIVVEGVTGYTIPTDDEDALVGLLLKLLRFPELARRMGEAGRERAERRFTWKAVVDRMENALGRLTPTVGQAP